MAVTSIPGASLEPQTIDEIILRLKEYAIWCVMNMASYRDKHDRIKIYNKYEDLFAQTVCTFQIIKDIHYSLLTETAREIVDFYSDNDKVIPFAYQLEQKLKLGNFE